MDNFYGPLSVCTTGFTVNIMRFYDTIFELGKIGGWEGHYRKKERGLPLCCLNLYYRRFVNMYEFHILKRFCNTNKYVITCVCTY